MAWSGEKLQTGDVITEAWISDTIDGIVGAYNAANSVTTNVSTLTNTVNSIQTNVTTLGTTTNTLTSDLANAVARIEALEANSAG